MKNALVNLYVVRRAARIAVEEGLITDDEISYRQQDGGYRVALSAFVSDRTSTALAATDWEALADERYLMEQDILGPREQVDVQHLLIESEDRSFAELMSRTLECRPGSMRATISLPWVEYSTTPRTKRGGLGFINRVRHTRHLRNRVLADGARQISEPVLTSFGVHFIRFNQRRSRDAIPQDVIQTRLIRAIKKERESALKGEVLAPFRGEAWPGVADIDEAPIAERVLRRLVPES